MASCCSWAKLKDITMKAGEFKDTGNPTRDMTPAEQAISAGADRQHAHTVHPGGGGRPQGAQSEAEDIRAIANGKVWTGEQALPMKLIDQLGDFQMAVNDTAKSVGISRANRTLVRPEKDRKSVLDLMFGDVSEYLPTKEKLLEQHMGFYYLWK